MLEIMSIEFMKATVCGGGGGCLDNRRSVILFRFELNWMK